jgi:hypothetical protein
MARKPKVQVRPPPSATTAQIARFVAGMAPRARTGESTVYTRRTGENAGEDLRRVTLYFPVELHKAARIAAVNADVPLSEFVVRLVAKGLKK